MSTPLYIKDWSTGVNPYRFLPSSDGLHTSDSVDWELRTEARYEYFMYDGPSVEYVYGNHIGERAYYSKPMNNLVREILYNLNEDLSGVRLFSCFEAHVERVQELLAADPDRTWGPLNGCFLNRYDHQRMALGWHADDFKGMDHSKCVAVVSFGEPREIWWRAKGQKGIIPPEQRQVLEPGSLFLMPPGFQHTHDHRIPKGDRDMGLRVSLTFRAFTIEDNEGDK